ncbi:MAG: DUF711 family protein, partial [Oscillospiraceae bacterium]|nr:DUF711 family protein [Oscillospiraceae bacterium]
MISGREIMQTIEMIERENLDIRTVTMGISIMDCCDGDHKRAGARIYDKVAGKAERLVGVCEAIEREFGIPIINKRVAVTPISDVAASSDAEDYAFFAGVMERSAEAIGVNFIGGFSALVHKGFTPSDRRLIDAIPRALSGTSRVCSSVNVASTKSGINMDACALMGEAVRRAAAESASQGSIACAKIVVFANA